MVPIRNLTDDVDHGVPQGDRHIGWHEAGLDLADLQAHVHVPMRSAGPAREVGADDVQPHAEIVGRVHDSGRHERVGRAAYPLGMSCAGDVTPQDAYAAVTGPERGVLVDVRTSAEWTYVGLPLVPDGAEPVRLVEWHRFPDGTVNEAFVEELRAAGLDEGQPIYFLCRTGARSQAAAAAATAAGLGPAHNVLGGFEGPHDDDGHRTVAGWKVAGLPWRQG